MSQADFRSVGYVALVADRRGASKANDHMAVKRTVHPRISSGNKKPKEHGRVLVRWWLWVDSNHRPQHYECKGYSWAERGADKLKLPEGGRTFVRFLAI